MRCYCCNKNLSDYESRLRSANSNEFLDMCKKCLESAEIPYSAPVDTEDTVVFDEDEFIEEDNDDLQ